MKTVRTFLFCAIIFLIAFISTNMAQDNTDLQGQTSEFRAGTHQFFLAGLGQTSAIIKPDESQFETAFEPIFLFKVNNNLLFESEIEAEIEDGGQAFNLEYAQLQYFMNDYLTFGAGRFLNPMNFFMERLHPAWINKMPDKPFFVHESTTLIASSHIGFQLRGAVPVRSTKVEYAVFIGMGPTLDPETGMLEFENFGDNNKNKVIGGHIGFLPVPELELGYGVETSKPGDEGSVYQDINAVNHSADFSYKSDIKALKGGVDVRGQFIWLNIDNPNIDSLNFDNNSQGGYAQIAFRPYNVNNFLQDVEIAYRYDWVDRPDNAPSNENVKRSSFGINYWIASSSLFKVTYETSETDLPDGSSSNSHRWIFQVAIGF